MALLINNLLVKTHNRRNFLGGLSTSHFNMDARKYFDLQNKSNHTFPTSHLTAGSFDPRCGRVCIVTLSGFRVHGGQDISLESD
jgi:hypothetical protein